MGSKADFYVGRGMEAEWLGSISWDGLPAGLPPEMLNVTTEPDYREAVTTFLEKRGDGVLSVDGWPWPWDTSHKTKYAYAFDKGTVWASCFGSSWWMASLPEPDHTTLRRKAAIFPDMSLIKKSGGVFIAADESP